MDGARADRQAVEADFGTRVGVELALRAVEPSDLARRAYSTNNDSWARLRASRRLYDFGATDAAREGLNFQAHCTDLFHFDLPWNPDLLEQRIGRLDRIGHERGLRGTVGPQVGADVEQALDQRAFIQSDQASVH